MGSEGGVGDLGLDLLLGDLVAGDLEVVDGGTKSEKKDSSGACVSFSRKRVKLLRRRMTLLPANLGEFAYDSNVAKSSRSWDSALWP